VLWLSDAERYLMRVEGSRVEEAGGPPVEQRLYGVVVEGAVVRVVSIPVERETDKLIYFRHGGEIFCGRTSVHKKRDAANIHTSARAALEAHVANLRAGLASLAERAERYESQIEAATRLADEADGEGFEGRTEQRRLFSQIEARALRIGDLLARDAAGAYLLRVDKLEPGRSHVAVTYTPLDPQMREGTMQRSETYELDAKLLRLVGRRIKS
jgi:hypothetical protein